ncbi:MAG: 16S rRNA (cytidine(1402)-2'-O)-methyltransferase [Gammaproteobacteria bacterium]
MDQGTLYVVATPIGNLDDMSPRAVRILSSVDRIAAEDTRHSRPLLQHFGIHTPMSALHEHNEREQAPRLLTALEGGESVALISDAGTPLISDPGYHLVRMARARGIAVVPVPGPSALMAALSAAGLPTDRFVFEGFLPSKAAARRGRLQALARETRTLVFFESPHRISSALEDMVAVFGPQRQAVLARELTKAFETVRGDSLQRLADWVCDDANQRRGELVLLVHGAEEAPADGHRESERVLELLLEELPVKQAASLAARITGAGRNDLYRRALELAGK